jgi:antitoxin component HigA of HigAB toxin-antitoxin module
MLRKLLFSWTRCSVQTMQIVTEADYARALVEIRRLVAIEPDHRTPDGERLELLTSLAEVFEAGRHALDPADIEAR